MSETGGLISKSVASYAASCKGHALEVQKPEECVRAMEMLALGAPYREICAETGLRPSNISKLKVRHGGAVEARREAQAEELEDLADVYREALARKADDLLSDDEKLAKVNPKDLALTTAILTDKPMQLRGEATSVVEHRSGVSLEDVMKMKAELAKEADIIDVK